MCVVVCVGGGGGGYVCVGCIELNVMQYHVVFFMIIIIIL